MTERKMRAMLRELVRELEKDAEEVRKRLDGYDPYNCGPQYLSGLNGGYIESIKKIKAKFGMRI